MFAAIETTSRRWFIHTRNVAALTTSCLLVYVTCGCSASKERMQSSPTRTTKAHGQALVDRAQEYWKLREDEAWDRLYDYLIPKLQSHSTIDEFRTWATKSEPFLVSTSEVLRCETDGSYGWAHIRYEATLRSFPTLPSRSAEHVQKWVRMDGAWYPVPKTELKNFPESPSLRDANAEKTLRLRFDGSWDARSRNDWKALYQFSDPRDREEVPLEKFADSENLFRYLRVKVRWVEVIGDRGRVFVTYDHKPSDPSLTKLPVQSTTITETWVRTNGNWYRDLIHKQG